MGNDYNPEDRLAAFEKSLEWGDRIPIGVIYKNRRETFEDRVPVIKERPLIDHEIFTDGWRDSLKKTLNEFF